MNTVADYKAAAAHGNPGRDSLKPYGDTTEGEYTLIAIRKYDGGKLYIDLEASGGPALLAARRDSLKSIDFHSGTITYGCFGASTESIKRVINALAGTTKGELSERIATANEKLKKRVVMTLDRDLDKPILTLP